MIGAFWYLTRRSLANRLHRQLLRLKQPRYAIALLVGIAYLVFFIFGRPQPRGGSAAGMMQPLILVLGSLLVLVGVIRWWFFGGDRSALVFSAAEIQFLFPAPVSRNALIRWKLFRAQILILLNTLIWILITRRARTPLPIPLYVVSLWVLFTTLSLHRLGASLTRAGVLTHWKTGLRRLLLPLTLAVAGLLLLVVPIVRRWPELDAHCCGIEFWSLFKSILDLPPASIVFYPFRLVMTPVSAATIEQWTQAILPALGILALHFVWVIRSNAAFEEAAVQASAEQAERVAARKAARSGTAPTTRTWPQVRLGSNGWPGTAIVWKNLLAIVRGSLSRRMLMALVVIGIVSVVMLREQASLRQILGSMAVAFAGFLIVMGHNWVRNDLRQDLAHLALLRSYPLPGSTIVLAEVIGSTIALTVIQYLCLLVAWFGIRDDPTFSRYVTTSSLLVTIPSLLLVLNAIVLSIQNAGALLFPDWVRLDRVRPGGFETLGQNILTTVFTLLLTLAGLVIPVASGFLALALFNAMLGNAAYLGATLGFIAGAVGEIIVILGWMGRVFERTEPA